MTWRRWAVVAMVGAYASVVIGIALEHASASRPVPLFDDALFFRRVAYNVLEHGFAGWNQIDGPVFMNTSQLYQWIAVLLLALFPSHYTAAALLWGATSLIAGLAVLCRGVARSIPAVLFAFVLMQSPPVMLSLTTGMDTATVLLVMTVCGVIVARHRLRERALLLVAMQWVVYLVRPDAALMSFLAVVGLSALERDWRGAGRFAAASLGGIALMSLGFYAYYGTPVPLATFLKLLQISAYDATYLSLGTADKLRNLAQMGVVVLPLLPIIVARRDRVNAVLTMSALAFIAFHGLATYEIVGYHARFYAPALPFLFVAALRGFERLQSRRQIAACLAVGAVSLLLAPYCFDHDLIENERGYEFGRVAARYYGVALCGIVVAPVLAVLPARLAVPLAPLLSFAVAVGQVRAVVPRSWRRLRPSADGPLDDAVARRGPSFVGVMQIKECFDEPFSLVHSEIGMVGVLFPESRIIDYTGLANPEVARGSFDFESTCEVERPEFIFRPHWTHRRLNQIVRSSPCLHREYRLIRTRRRSSAPLYVRKDMLDMFHACDPP